MTTFFIFPPPRSPFMGKGSLFPFQEIHIQCGTMKNQKTTKANITSSPSTGYLLSIEILFCQIDVLCLLYLEQAAFISLFCWEAGRIIRFEFAFIALYPYYQSHHHVLLILFEWLLPLPSGLSTRMPCADIHDSLLNSCNQGQPPQPIGHVLF